MPSKPRKAPTKLAEKLKKIRVELGLSQTEMVKWLCAEEEINRGKISEYERGQRIPALHLLLAYAKIANVWLDYIVSDDLDLPPRLPALSKNNEI